MSELPAPHDVGLDVQLLAGLCRLQRLMAGGKTAQQRDLGALLEWAVQEIVLAWEQLPDHADQLRSALPGLEAWSRRNHPSAPEVPDHADPDPPAPRPGPGRPALHLFPRPRPRR